MFEPGGGVVVLGVVVECAEASAGIQAVWVVVCIANWALYVMGCALEAWFEVGRWFSTEAEGMFEQGFWAALETEAGLGS